MRGFVLGHALALGIGRRELRLRGSDENVRYGEVMSHRGVEKVSSRGAEPSPGVAKVTWR